MKASEIQNAFLELDSGLSDEHKMRKYFKERFTSECVFYISRIFHETSNLVSDSCKLNSILSFQRLFHLFQENYLQDLYVITDKTVSNLRRSHIFYL